MNKKKALLPLSLAGPGNQFCGIKEALVLAHLLEMDIALPKIIPHGTIRNRSKLSHAFDDTFNLDTFRQRCLAELGVGVTEVSTSDNFHNIMMRTDDTSRKQAMQYLELHRQAMEIPSHSFEILHDTPLPNMLSSVEEIQEWGHAIRGQLGIENAQIVSLIGIFNSIKLGGINENSDAAPCNKNHCLNCPPSAELSKIYEAVNNCFRFSSWIVNTGDQFIREQFGGRSFIGFHLRICDLPRNRTFQECYSGYTEEQVVAAVARIGTTAGVGAGDTFLAAPPQLFNAVSNLHLVNDHQHFKIATNDDELDPYYASLIEQYICSEASVFIRSYTNTPDIERKQHTRSSWSELVEGIRRSEGNYKNVTIDDEIQAHLSPEATESNEHAVTSVQLEIDSTDRLESGDYLPNLFIENDHAKLDVQNFATQEFFILCNGARSPLHRDQLPQDAVASLANLYIINAQASDTQDKRTLHDEPAWWYLTAKQEQLVLYHVGPNLKISNVFFVNNPDQLSSLDLARPSTRELPAPVITIPNAVTPELAEHLIAALEAEPDTTTVRDDKFKRRTHLQTGPELSELLDKKLVKSVFPEIEKVFYDRVTHRETYKICLYAGESSGAFGRHRDTIDPYRHRRYAMTLALNDDYEGGGICFPEYSPTVLPLEKYSAVIFPGSLFHEVQPIDRGKRYVVISFFFGDGEAALKPDAERFKIKTNRGTGALSLRAITPTSMD